MTCTPFDSTCIIPQNLLYEWPNYTAYHFEAYSSKSNSLTFSALNKSFLLMFCCTLQFRNFHPRMNDSPLKFPQIVLHVNPQNVHNQTAPCPRTYLSVEEGGEGVEPAHQQWQLSAPDGAQVRVTVELQVLATEPRHKLTTACSRRRSATGKWGCQHHITKPLKCNQAAGKWCSKRYKATTRRLLCHYNKASMFPVLRKCQTIGVVIDFSYANIVHWLL